MTVAPKYPIYQIDNWCPPPPNLTCVVNKNVLSLSRSKYGFLPYQYHITFGDVILEDIKSSQQRYSLYIHGRGTDKDIRPVQLVFCLMARCGTWSAWKAKNGLLPGKAHTKEAENSGSLLSRRTAGKNRSLRITWDWYLSLAGR